MMQTLRAQRFGWYVYDWANSAFSTSVVTVFLGPYLTSVAKSAAQPSGHISPFGIEMHPGAWFSFAVSASVLLQVFVLPIVGAMADRSHVKKSLLLATAFMGAIATTLMYFVSVESGNYIYGGLLFVVANVAFGASMVVANAFLSELAKPAERDSVSSRGWAAGYLGGGLLLLIHLLWFNSATASGSDTGLVVRMIIASAGIWWALFTLVPMRLLKGAPKGEVHKISLKASFLQLKHTLSHMAAYKMTLLFFIAYLLYNDAIQTVITMASAYGQEELGLGIDVLTKSILMVQFVAMGGSLLFERIASMLGTKNAIVIGLLGWIGVVVSAYAAVTNEFQFYVLAFVIALVLGGTQALSRSLFSQMIPPGKNAEYFSLYEISDKGTSWLGPLFFGLALTYTGSYRTAVFSLIIFLFAGLMVLLKVNVPRAIEEAQRTQA